MHYDVVMHKCYCFDNKYGYACYDRNIHNGLVMKVLNIHISGSNDLIDFPFTGGVYHVIRCLYTEYLRNLKLCHKLSFSWFIKDVFVF